MYRLFIRLLRRLMRRPERIPDDSEIARLESALDVPDEQRTVPRYKALIDHGR